MIRLSLGKCRLRFHRWLLNVITMVIMVGILACLIGALVSNLKVEIVLMWWVSYNQRNITYNNSPYRFDTTELPKELIYGGTYKFTRLR